MKKTIIAAVLASLFFIGGIGLNHSADLPSQHSEESKQLADLPSQHAPGKYLADLPSQHAPGKYLADLPSQHSLKNLS